MSRQDFVRSLLCVAGACAGLAAPAWAETHIRIMPPARATFAVGQQFDLRVEATSTTATAPTGLRVTVDGTDVTARNVAPAPGVTGPTAGPSHTANVLVRAYSFTRPGAHVIRATTDDGASAEVTIDVGRWQVSQAGVPRAKNIIFFLGDGMGIAHRTAARLLAHGVTEGRANGALAMDTMPVTGQVMTPSLNAVVTDSAPGMSAYSTGNKANNNQEGVFPDNTEDEFDNPRVEYIGAFLRRMRGPGFNVGLVTTADLTDATPAANAVHTAQREASAEIAARYFDERAQNGLTVLMGGGRRHFEPVSTATSRKDGRTLTTEFRQAGFLVVKTRAELLALSQASPAPKALLGLFHPSHMSVAFDKVGAARYSDELAQPRYADLRDQPMLDEMARAAIATLSASSPRGFYLLVEGASIDKRAHAADSERTIWDTIEFDRAVQVALDFAQKTNSDRDPSNDTLVIVTADHGEVMNPAHDCASALLQLGCSFNHSVTVYDDELVVPLGMALPGRVAAGRTITTPVSHADVPPTIMDVLGLGEARGQVGRSLKAALAGGELAPAPVYADGRFASALRVGDWKLIVHAPQDDISPRSRMINGEAYKYELFDLVADRLETTNLALAQEDVTKTLLGDLKSLRLAMRARFERAAPLVGPTVPEATTTPSGEGFARNRIMLVADKSPRRLVGTVSSIGNLRCPDSPAPNPGDTNIRCTRIDDHNVALDVLAPANTAFVIELTSAPWDAALRFDWSLDGTPLPADRLRLGAWGIAVLPRGGQLDNHEHLSLAVADKAPLVQPNEAAVYLWRSAAGSTSNTAVSSQPTSPEDATNDPNADQQLGGEVKKILKDLGYTH